MSRYASKLASMAAALTAAFLLAVSPSVDAAQSVPSATGGWVNSIGQSWTLNARQHPDGTASGRFKSFVDGIRVEADVTCISVVGNQAYISGVMTRFDPAPDPVEGFGFAMRVTDGGEGDGSADSHSPAFFFPAGAPPCDNPGFQAFFDGIVAGQERDVLIGNLQVRD